MPITGNAEPNREELIQMAIRTAKENNAQGARMMFQRVLQEDKNNERAMLWMAKLAPDIEERKRWLGRVIKVNPDNIKAKQALEALSNKETAAQNRKTDTIIIAGASLFMVISLVFTILWAFA